MLVYVNDEKARQEFMQIKHKNKVRLAKYIKEHNGIDVDPRSIFDIQVKRLHEYKRQLLNILHIMYLYDRLKTKRYPTARLRRLVLDAVLDVPAAGLPALPPYLLVLGAKRSALPLLKHAKIPAGTSLAGLAGQDQKLQIAADMHSKAVDFSLLCRYKIQPMGHAYTAHVVLL